MMNSKHNTPTTTTEELIVQYLDGELVRKELETVLFDRLAHSDEARMLLREYLVVRGAIRVSREHKQFQLSDDLDARTRARVEQMMEAMAAEELLAPAATIGEPLTLRGFSADRGAIASSPITRQVKRWQLRGSIAALSLLLTVGVAWFVTGNTNSRNEAALSSSEQPMLNVGTAPLAQAQQEPMQESASPVIAEPASVTQKHSVTHLHTSGNSSPASSAHFVSDGLQAHDSKVDEPASTTTASDPAADMISHRYTKAIGDAKNEVVVSGKDRL